MKSYLVKWEIKVKATSHLDAAEQADDAIFCGEPITLAYHVRVPHEKGRRVRLLTTPTDTHWSVDSSEHEQK